MGIRHFYTSLAAGIMLFAVPAFSGTINDNLLAYWAFDEGTGSAVGDYTHGANGTIAGGVTWTTGTDAKFGSGLRFDGNYGSKVSLPSGGSLSNPGSAVSFSVWLKSTESVDTLTTSYRSIFNSSAGQDFYILYYDKGTTQVRFKVTSTNGTATRVGAGVADVPGANIWYHLAAVYDGTTATVYINGVAKASLTGASGALKSPQVSAIGAKGAGGDQTWLGAMDDLAVWNRALTATEVQYLATCNQPLSTVLTTGIAAAADWSMYE